MGGEKYRNTPLIQKLVKVNEVVGRDYTVL